MKRRRVLTAAGGLVGGGAAIATAAHLRGDDTIGRVAAASPSIDIPDASAGLEAPPSAINLAVSGTFAWTLSDSVDQTRADVFLVFDGSEEQIGKELVFSPGTEGSGSYSVEADVLDHPAVDPTMFDVPVGETESWTFTVAVEVSAVDNNEYLETTRVEDDFAVTITGEGMLLEASGSGSVEIVE